MTVLLIVLFLALVLLSWAWVKGIDYMKENHPDYKGEDWLNWNEDDKLDINLWDKEEKENRKDYDEN
jgi:hypothetical protein